MPQVLDPAAPAAVSHDASTALCDAQPRRPATLREAIKLACAVRHYSPRTFDAYWHWARQFVLWSGRRPVRELGKAEVEQFLTWLADERQASASTQRQALAALLFLYRQVLGLQLPWLDNITRAKQPTRLPCVLSQDEVRRLLAALPRTSAGLALSLAYGTGMRLMEILRLTPADVRGGEVIVSARSKSGRSRVVPLPAEAARIAKRLPFAIGVPLLTKRFNQARVAAGLPQIRFHDLRHAYGTWLAEAGTDGPTIRDVMGHSSLTVTSRYLQTAGENARRAVAKLPRLGSARGQKRA